MDSLPSPPMSPRKRREVQRGSEELEGELSLREYLMRMDVFRVTVPVTNPLPLPLNPLRDGHPLLESFAHIKDIASMSLLRRGVTCESIALYGSPAGRVLRISSNMPVTKEWSSTVREIHRELYVTGLQDITVEILNWEKVYRLKQYRIPDGDQEKMIVNGWKKAKEDIMALIDRRFAQSGQNWNTVCVFMCGRSQELSEPTIVITADAKTLLDWSALSFALQHTLIKNNFFKFKVEFAVGNIVPSKRFDVMTARGNGDSVGIVGDARFDGTLGGFVRLTVESPPQIRLCAVTCHHVTRLGNHQSKEFADVLPLQPVGTNDPRATAMRSPAKTDYDETLSDEKELLARYEKNIATTEAEQERQDGFLAPYRERYLETERKNRDAAQSRIAMLESRMSRIGITIASSGFRLNRNNHKMDWALIEVSKERFQANSAPDNLSVSSLAPEHRPQNREYNNGVNSLTKVRNVQPGDWVIMQGRTSGLTTGEVHKMRMEIKDWKTRNPISTEIIVIATGKPEARLRDVFSEAGDSGAWIFDADGVVVGQQIAHREPIDGSADLTVMSPISDVFRDIEEITGGKISLPVD
ncbi:hypothetical protein MMC14_005639 [Varicellaria rhodocarpa]|nr:hypothetical protein [Varicellaria rhodocarpa]